MNKKNILIACSGSVATIKLNELINCFHNGNNEFPIEVNTFLFNYSANVKHLQIQFFSIFRFV